MHQLVFIIHQADGEQINVCNLDLNDLIRRQEDTNRNVPVHLYTTTAKFHIHFRSWSDSPDFSQLPRVLVWI